jgi:hypothetical protein
MYEPIRVLGCCCRRCTWHFQAEYNKNVIQLAFLVACLYTAIGVFRLGFLIRFLSHPVITGFTSGAALVIAAGQVKYLLGVSYKKQDTLQVGREMLLCCCLVFRCFKELLLLLFCSCCCLLCVQWCCCWRVLEPPCDHGLHSRRCAGHCSRPWQVKHLLCVSYKKQDALQVLFY